MRALLDTHVFLWWIADDDRLSIRARSIMKNGDHSLLFSVASAWEILIKVQIGKLEIPAPASRFLKKELQRNEIDVLPLHLSHTLNLETLPVHHRDPFDRILIAQALEEGVAIVTADPLFASYDVETVW